MTFPQRNQSWRFVPVSYLFPNPANPFSQTFPEIIALDDIVGNYWTANFVGIKVGDVNSSANPATFGGGNGDERSNFDNSLIFTTKDIELVAGRDYAIPFVAHPELVMAGFQFTLDFEDKMLDFTAVDNEGAGLLKASNFGLPQSLGTSAVTVSWVNESGKNLKDAGTLFTLKFRAKSNGRLSSALTINSLQTAAEAYAGDFSSKNEAFETWGVALEYEPAAMGEPVLFRNFPNPFDQKTTVQFYLPEAAQVSFRLHDQFGRLLKTWSGDFDQGRHELPLDLADIPAGILLLEMDAGDFQRTIKMMNYK